mmetsp:Transcript_5243/g.6442  ORF Transcript_5243/g.6442 Transcript_5243/m.6442 type:complete len:236 (-) Transcript_5243:1590-2297(-)
MKPDSSGGGGTAAVCIIGDGFGTADCAAGFEKVFSSMLELPPEAAAAEPSVAAAAGLLDFLNARGAAASSSSSESSSDEEVHSPSISAFGRSHDAIVAIAGSEMEASVSCGAAFPRSALTPCNGAECELRTGSGCASAARLTRAKYSEPRDEEEDVDAPSPFSAFADDAGSPFDLAGLDPFPPFDLVALCFDLLFPLVAGLRRPSAFFTPFPPRGAFPAPPAPAFAPGFFVHSVT